MSLESPTEFELEMAHVLFIDVVGYSRLLNSYVLGEKDEAFVWLEKAYQDHDVRLCRVKVDPKWDLARSDPRFLSMLKRLELE